jgi:hypothetical protein
VSLKIAFVTEISIFLPIVIAGGVYLKSTLNVVSIPLKNQRLSCFCACIWAIKKRELKRMIIFFMGSSIKNAKQVGHMDTCNLPTLWGTVTRWLRVTGSLPPPSHFSPAYPPHALAKSTAPGSHQLTKATAPAAQRVSWCVAPSARRCCEVVQFIRTFF